jgi:hypothetical protein
MTFPYFSAMDAVAILLADSSDWRKKRRHHLKAVHPHRVGPPPTWLIKILFNN